MNENDSIQLSNLLIQKLNIEPTKTLSDADIVIINTCSVREKPEHKVFSEIGRFAKIKSGRDIILGVIGCVAQEYGQKIFSKTSLVDFVAGTHNIHLIPDMISDVLKNRKGIANIAFYDKIESLNIATSPYDDYGVKAYVSIMQGCENFCSYCIVPFVRGKEYSRKSHDIYNEILRLVQMGVKEVTLLGQNVNSYGKKSSTEISFPELLYKISEIKGLDRIRFTTSHPKDFGDDLVYAIKNIDKVCNQVHLPIQSGSNKILKLMKRGYSREDYLDKFYKLKDNIVDIRITTDFIVGFPYETEEDFQDTIKILNEVKYISSFSFKYSPRPFSDNSEIDTVDDSIKRKRLKILQDLQKSITLQYNKDSVGKIFDILVDSSSKKSQEELSGRSYDNRIVNFKGDTSLLGKFVKVKITQAFQNSLRGELL